MNRRFLITLLLLILAAVLFLIISRFIVRTEELVPDLPPEVSTEVSEEIFVLPLKEELAGSYVLTALFSDELQLSESELTTFRERGIPLNLTLENDGTASLAIFDTRIELEVDPDGMLLLGGGQSFPFFYQDGRLTVWDAGSRAVFVKTQNEKTA